MNKPQSLDLFLILLMLVACLARAESLAGPAPEAGTGLEGVISLHGISGGPIKQGVSDSRPLGNTTFVVMKGETVVTSFTTDEQGWFHVALPPGHYRISRKDWKSRVGFYGPFDVEISAGQMAKVQWKCQTGMQ